ncbi:MAG: DUF2059 domain-containing protein [Magnetococcales bacterium]|nr:DUF2059 domain-containing protein [Magnetococcales bacterium]
MAKNLPPERRAEFTTLMKEVTRLNNVEKFTRAAMVKIFTADELNALADFYGSQHGSNAMKKFGVYMAEIMPAVQEEMLRATREVNERLKKQ